MSAEDAETVQLLEDLCGPAEANSYAALLLRQARSERRARELGALVAPGVLEQLHGAQRANATYGPGPGARRRPRHDPQP